MLRLVQLSHPVHGRRVAVVAEPNLRILQGCSTVYDLAQRALHSNQPLRSQIEQSPSGEQLNYDVIYSGQSDWRLLSPIDHPEPSRCYVTGTGLTHKGSAENRQSMHVATDSRQPSTVSSQPQPPAPSSQPLSDSMKMFQIGLDGGRPAAGSIGAAPEWFYKGVGTIVRAHNEPLSVPPYGLDGGEEAEIAGIYMISEDGTPFRVGLVQGNEFSDHVMESRNYLYLAPSKLRDCSLGPELVLDFAFDDVPGESSVERDGKIIWQATQATGELRMCHSVANLEHHHFKYAEHRHPGDIHIHFFGADMFSFKDRLRLENGDLMSVSFKGFGRPLRNPLQIDRSPDKYVGVKPI
jgi:hypothetical protein